METLPAWIETHAKHGGSGSAQDRRELQPQEIFTLLTLTEPREFTDEGLELIEMRYQQMLALMNLEDLFAEGQLDGM
jgi:hypothetical protein